MEKGKNITIAILTTIIITLIALIILAYKGIIKVDLKTEKEEIKTEEKQEKTTLTEQEALGIGTILYDKATEAYETWKLFPYCGVTYQKAQKAKSIKEFGDRSTGTNMKYFDSGMKNLDELKDYLRGYFSEEIINEKITKEPITDVSLLNDLKYWYSDYVIYNDKLYCRMESTKGGVDDYADKYDIKVKEIKENKIVYDITSEYFATNVSKECTRGYNADCECTYSSNCKESDFTTEKTEFIIEKNDNGNWIVTKYVLHH